nr:glycosyltransferase [Schlegelella koreensis]
MQRHEAALLARADLVFAGPGRHVEVAPTRPDAVALPNGVDAASWRGGSRAVHDSGALDAIEQRIGRPRLGFAGLVDERIDLDLVAALADADPSRHVVMVGPITKAAPAALPRRPNLHWLGAQPDDVLAALVDGWDVCLLPFEQGVGARRGEPIEALEFAAAGKPIVATNAVATLGNAVATCTDRDAFIATCRALLAEAPAARERRNAALDDAVRHHAWDDVAQRAQAAIEAQLARLPGSPSQPDLSSLGPPRAAAVDTTSIDTDRR